ncbi:MAG: proton-conducting transporter membrane subunit [Pirellulaceae bacterium]
MIELHLPWLELAVLLPALGALWVRFLRNPDQARRHSLAISGLTLLFAIGAWYDFTSLHTFQAHDRWDVFSLLFHQDAVVIDELSAPLLPLGALLYFLMELGTLRTKVRRFSFSSALASEAILLATLSCKSPWGLIALLALGALPPLLELRSRRKPTRVFALHMGLFVLLLLVGQTLLQLGGRIDALRIAAVVLLGAAVLLRSGIVPVHCWMTDLFEHASFGTALLFVTPMVGAYGAMRLVLPIAPDWALRAIVIVSLITAVYAAGMALVQQEARRFFCYLFLSHSSLVLVGLEIATPIGLTGALCVWLSVGLSLGGFGLTLRSVEARTGRLSLTQYHGLYEHIPMLAGFFLLTGLASIGFPGTIGFVAVELLVDGAVQVSPLVGAAVVIAAALNGLAVLMAYFRIFTGTRHVTSIDIRGRLPERVAVLILTALILGGGLFPQPGVSSRYHAAQELVAAREKLFPSEESEHETAWNWPWREFTALFGDVQPTKTPP